MISSSGNMTKQSSRKIHSCEDNDALADDHSTPEERPPDGDDKSDNDRNAENRRMAMTNQFHQRNGHQMAMTNQAPEDF